MEAPIFAFDFSMNKPAMCSFIDNTLEIFVWPSMIDKASWDRLNGSGVHVHCRNLPPAKHQGLNEHELIIEHVNRSVSLANIIVEKIEELLSEHNITDKESVIIANEGFAFSAKGDAALDLSGYKYILMYTLYMHGFRIFRTYSPITIKKTANCSKKGLGKDAMIEAITTQDENVHRFISVIKNEPDYLKKKTNYVLCTDDVADAFWCLKTTLKDLKIKSILD